MVAVSANSCEIELSVIDGKVSDSAEWKMGKDFCEKYLKNTKRTLISEDISVQPDST